MAAAVKSEAWCEVERIDASSASKDGRCVLSAADAAVAVTIGLSIVGKSISSSSSVVKTDKLLYYVDFYLLSADCCHAAAVAAPLSPSSRLPESYLAEASVHEIVAVLVKKAKHRQTSWLTSQPLISNYKLIGGLWMM